MKHKYIDKFRIILTIIFVLINIVHFIFKDKFYPISALYYAFPPLIIIILGVILSIFYLKNKNMFYVLVLLNIIIAGYWLNNFFVFHEHSKLTAKGEYILFWNIDKNKQFPIDIIVEKSKKYNLSFIALVESRFITNDELRNLKNKLPSYSFKKLRGDMFLGVKGKIDSIVFHFKEDRFKFNYLITTIENNKRSILIIDVASWPLIERGTILETVVEFAEDKNVSFLVGDFNTPYESIYFNEYKLKFNSFHSISDGFTATWPNWVPLLELDQIWVNKSIEPIMLKKFYYQSSDHALLIGGYK